MCMYIYVCMYIYIYNVYTFVYIYILWIWMDFKEQHFWHIILKFWACCSSWSNSSSDSTIAIDLLQVPRPICSPSCFQYLPQHWIYYDTNTPYQPWLLKHWEHSSYQRSSLGSGCWWHINTFVHLQTLVSYNLITKLHAVRFAPHGWKHAKNTSINADLP